MKGGMLEKDEPFSSTYSVYPSFFDHLLLMCVKVDKEMFVPFGLTVDS